MSILGAKDRRFLEPRKVACSECHHENPQKKRVLIKSTFSDFDKVRSGEFFDVACEKCGKVGRHLYPLVYVDHDRFFYIRLDPTPDKIDEDYRNMTDIAYKVSRALTDKTGGVTERVKYSTVSTLEELLENIVICGVGWLNPKYAQRIKRTFLCENPDVKYGDMDNWRYAESNNKEIILHNDKSDRDIAMPLSAYRELSKTKGKRKKKLGPLGWTIIICVVSIIAAIIFVSIRDNISPIEVLKYTFTQ